MILDLMKSRRSVRQFKQTPIPADQIENCINAARLAPSAKNIQPLEYLYIDEKEKVDAVFPFCKWAGYIDPKGNPEKDKTPVAYLFVLVNKNHIESDFFKYDVGAANENFIISALSYGIGSCWLLSINRPELRELLNIPEHYNIDSAIALGYSDEKHVVVETEHDIKYWKDDDKTFFVPKRKVLNVYHKNKIEIK